MFCHHFEIRLCTSLAVIYLFPLLPTVRRSKLMFSQYSIFLIIKEMPSDQDQLRVIGQFQKISIPNHGRLPCFNPPLPSEIPKCVTPPMPSEFHNREPPLPFGNPKSRPWYSMDIFWNRPLRHPTQM